jgi:hypothetical protein
MTYTASEFPFDITAAVPVTITKGRWYKMPSLLRCVINGQKYTIRYDADLKKTIVYIVTII